MGRGVYSPYDWGMKGDLGGGNGGGAGTGNGTGRGVDGCRLFPSSSFLPPPPSINLLFWHNRLPAPPPCVPSPPSSPPPLSAPPHPALSALASESVPLARPLSWPTRATGCHREKGCVGAIWGRAHRTPCLVGGHDGSPGTRGCIFLLHLSSVRPRATGTGYARCKPQGGETEHEAG